jgi:hypothetical protein
LPFGIRWTHTPKKLPKEAPKRRLRNIIMVRSYGNRGRFESQEITAFNTNHTNYAHTKTQSHQETATTNYSNYTN